MHKWLVVLVLLMTTAAWGQWTEPVILPPPINVNPPGEYYYSTISADGRVLCMTICAGITDDDVYFSEMLDDGSWTVPVNAGPNVNNNQRNLSPSITNDRQRLYYVSYTGSYDIMVSERTGPNWDDWSPGVPLPPPVNRGREFTAQILWDDSTLVFTSTGQPGLCLGGDCPYTSRLQPDGSWSEPMIALTASQLRTNPVYHPCITDSGRTIVWGMWAAPDREVDIFYAPRNDSGFGPIVRCDSTINSPVHDSEPSCPADGSLLYFESRRPDNGGAGRLYVARRVISSAEPRRSEASPRRTIEIVPSLGTSDTPFQIRLPRSLQGSPVIIYNVLGQKVAQLLPSSFNQTTLYWTGGHHEQAVVGSGVYFFVARNDRDISVGKAVVVQ